jgi:uncharacterized membrane protein YsdA (DUF1294 family)
MMDILLSHWAFQFYLPYIIVLFILFVVYRDKSIVAYRKLWRLPERTRHILASRWRPRWRMRPRQIR